MVDWHWLGCLADSDYSLRKLLRSLKLRCGQESSQVLLIDLGSSWAAKEAAGSMPVCGGGQHASKTQG